MAGRGDPDVEVYRRPTDGHWIALCWVRGCRWKFGGDAVEQERDVRQRARTHRRQHTRAGDRG